MTIFDEKNAVSGRDVRSLEPGVVESDAGSHGDFCKMTAISSTVDVNVSDYVETSGTGGIYPEGIIIGKIIEIKPEQGSIAKVAIISPAMNLDHLLKVFVLK
jgi:rod shape-determining protein MreC